MARAAVLVAVAVLPGLAVPAASPPLLLLEVVLVVLLLLVVSRVVELGPCLQQQQQGGWQRQPGQQVKADALCCLLHAHVRWAKPACWC